MSERVYQELLARIGEANPQPRLEPSRRLVDLLGNPQDAAPVVHLTGTNGKTSTSRIVESVLRATGLRTGLLTSPHLDRFTERIMIDGEPISDEAVLRNWRDISPYLAMVDDDLIAQGELPLTFFEALSALAFASFADAPVDVAVVEVGMGGEWDSTNVVTADVAVFTPIDLDHLGRIGNSIEEIAQTKAGILKPGTIAVSARQHPAVEAILRERARSVGAEIRFADDEFALLDARQAVGGQLISVRGISASYPELFLPLFGRHQAENAALAIAAVESLLGNGSVALAEDVLAEGLGESRSPGRFEIIGVGPTIVADGAHNPHGVRSLVSALRDTFQVGAASEVAVVLGVLGDKDARGILDELRQLTPRLFITNSDSDRAVPANELAALATAAGFEVTRSVDSGEAIAAAREWARSAPNDAIGAVSDVDAGGQSGRFVVVTGSLTLVAQARRLAASDDWMRA